MKTAMKNSAPHRGSGGRARLLLAAFLAASREPWASAGRADHGEDRASVAFVGTLQNIAGLDDAQARAALQIFVDKREPVMCVCVCVCVCVCARARMKLLSDPGVVLSPEAAPVPPRVRPGRQERTKGGCARRLWPGDRAPLLHRGRLA